MKQRILGTVVGRVALILRDKLTIVKSALFKAESVGMVANDLMATFLVTHLCQTNKNFIDVGAHIGSILSEVHHNTPSVKIIAIEAMPDKALKLREKFPYIELHEYAAGEVDEGDISFYVNTKQSGYSSLGKPLEDGRPEIIEIKVSIRMMDSLIAPDDIDVIKIDVEGAELGVLRGSESIINNSRPVIMFESSSCQNNPLGYTKNDMWEFFNLHNYEVFIPNRLAHNGSGLSKEGFSEAHVYPRRTTNYFAIPKERKIEIRDRTRRILNIS